VPKPLSELMPHPATLISSWRLNALRPVMENKQPAIWALLSVAFWSHEGDTGVACTFDPRDKIAFGIFKPPSAPHELLREACRSVRLKLSLRCGDEEIVFDETRLS
jgi:hypothetical protein